MKKIGEFEYSEHEFKIWCDRSASQPKWKVSVVNREGERWDTDICETSKSAIESATIYVDNANLPKFRM